MVAIEFRVFENRYFGPQIFWGVTIPRKSLCSVLLPTDTHHVVKFCKDPFRGIDRVNWKKQHLQNRCRCHIGGGQKRGRHSEQHPIKFYLVLGNFLSSIGGAPWQLAWRQLALLPRSSCATYTLSISTETQLQHHGQGAEFSHHCTSHNHRVGQKSKLLYCHRHFKG